MKNPPLSAVDFLKSIILKIINKVCIHKPVRYITELIAVLIDITNENTVITAPC